MMLAGRVAVIRGDLRAGLRKSDDCGHRLERARGRRRTRRESQSRTGAALFKSTIGENGELETTLDQRDYAPRR